MTKIHHSKSILYITYDGILEPLGQSQVLSYLECLSLKYSIHLISFEKSIDTNNKNLVTKIEKRVQNSGISWTPLKYHKSLSILSTSLDLIVGFFTSLKIIYFNRVQIVHARSYVPGIIALALKKSMRTSFIFDMRGFWADERVDGGLWKKHGALYKMAKWFEKKFLQNTDHIISLTEAGISAMKKFPYLHKNMPPYSVIPTCANLEHFKVEPSKNKSFTLGYVGSVGLWYNFDATLLCFNELLKIRKDSSLLIVNKNEHTFIQQKIREHKIPNKNVKLVSASFSDIPNYINSMDAGIFFIRPYFSKQASAPTKLAEFLGCGIPCLSNDGIGDMTQVFERYKVGISIKNFSIDEYQRGIQQILKLSYSDGISDRCRETAEKIFSLEFGVERYAKVYEGLIVPR